MEIIVKKTTELTDEEQAGILSLFHLVFRKERSLEHFHNQFLNNPLGYSYHAMIMESKQIVGSFSYIPSYYLVNSKRYLFAVAVDVMLSEEYRGFANFYKMVVTIHDYIKKEGVFFIYAFPNDNSYFVYIKAKLMKDIGNLNTYCLPYRIGGIKSTLKACNLLSIAFVKIYMFLTSLVSNTIVHHFPIEKETTTYNATRYKRLDGNYNITDYKGSKFVYKLMEYEGVRSALLIDVFEKSAANFNKAIRYIIKNHHKEFDILLYVGWLPFKCHGLLKVPPRFAPKNFYFTGEVLQKNEIDSGLFFNINNWDVNLSNYDLL
jgi:hypothetical protein